MRDYKIPKFIALLLIAAAAVLFNFRPEEALAAMPFAFAGFTQETGINWGEFAKHRGDPEMVKALAQDITDFFREPMVKKVTGAKYTVADSNLAGQNPAAGVYGQKPLVDFGYQEIFAPVDMRQSTSKSFDLFDLTNGVVFEQLEEGQQPQVRSVSSGKASVSFLRFGAALGFLDDWFRFNEHYRMDEILVQVRNKSYDKKAKLHYDLFTALGAGINQAFATDDATTIDNACVQIISDCKEKGYFDSENQQFIVLANPGLRRRLTKAIWPQSSNPNDATSQGPVHNIKALVTSWHIPNTSYYVILPGNKLKSGTWEDLNSEGQRDALRRAEDIGWHEKYNAVIGDSQQVRRNALI